MSTALKEKGTESKSDTILTQMETFLSSVYALYVKTQNYHWNVTGPLFPQLHELFERQYQELLQEVDEIAERIRTMGYFVPASLGVFQKLSVVKDETKTPLPATEMIRQLARDHATVVEQAKDLFAALDDAEDDSTSDFVIDQIKKHEKTLWMLRSSLEGNK